MWLPERIDQGYVLVLPGSWGETPADHGIVRGLVDADIRAAIEIHDWTAGPSAAGLLMVPYNLRALKRNREQARLVAAKLVDYQQRYPGRPVQLIGYSGGGGVAVLALEALPPETKITNAVLLAASLGYNYDVQPALRHVEQGIQNFYSPLDVPVLMTLCTVVGNTDGSHRFPAGAVGFHSASAVADVRKTTSGPQLKQYIYHPKMLATGHIGGHFGWISRPFVARHVAPVLTEAWSAQLAARKAGVETIGSTAPVASPDYVVPTGYASDR